MFSKRYYELIDAYYDNIIRKEGQIWKIAYFVR